MFNSKSFNPVSFSPISFNGLTVAVTAVGRDDDPVSKFIDITDKEARQMLVAVMRTFDW